MTNHERCLAALAGKPVDRAPRYLHGIACDVASALLGRPAYGGTGSLHYAEASAWMKGRCAHEEFEAKLIEDLVAIYRVLDIDVFRMPWRMDDEPARQLDEYTFVYGDPYGAHDVYRYIPDSGDYGMISTTCGDDVDEDAYEQEIHRQEAAADQLDRVPLPEEHVRICRKHGQEFFTVLDGNGLGVGLSAQRLMLLAMAPQTMRREIMLQGRYTAALAKCLAGTSYPRVILGGLDMAGNDGPMYSPQQFREVVLPDCQHLMEQLRQMKCHYIFRSDGNLWPVAEMLFGEAGVPGYGEVDREASMTVGDLRKRFPSLVVWGNMPSRLLSRGSAAQVRDEAQKIVAESNGTGYFHGCSNAIMKGTSVENVLAMYSV